MKQISKVRRNNINGTIISDLNTDYTGTGLGIK
jgi:hypothetical protein